jgi:hypothetical protein
VSVDDDVVKSDGDVASWRARRIASRNPYSSYRYSNDGLTGQVAVGGSRTVMQDLFPAAWRPGIGRKKPVVSWSRWQRPCGDDPADRFLKATLALALSTSSY